MSQVVTRTINILGLDVAINNANDLREAAKLLNQELNKTELGSKAYQDLNEKMAIVKATQDNLRREQRGLRTDFVASGRSGAGAYRELSAQLIKTRNQYKDLAAAGKENTKEAKELLVVVGQLDGRLKKIDKTVGQHQRNVGNYSSALSGLGKSLLTSLGIVGGVSVIGSAIRGIAIESRELAIEARGIEFAFSRIEGSSEVFDRIKEKTRGLLSDLDIKQGIVEFDNFNISLKEADTLLEFVTVRAGS